MDNLTINIINNNNQKVYTSFVVRDKNNQPQQITTDSQSGWKPPVLQAAQCECNLNKYQYMNCKETTQTITIPVIRDDRFMRPASVIYFSFSPGYAGGNEGSFDSIPVHTRWSVESSSPPIYSLKNMNAKCTIIDRYYALVAILLIISLGLIIFGIIRHNLLWLLGVFFLLLTFMVVFAIVRLNENSKK